MRADFLAYKKSGCGECGPWCFTKGHLMVNMGSQPWKKGKTVMAMAKPTGVHLAQAFCDQIRWAELKKRRVTLPNSDTFYNVQAQKGTQTYPLWPR